MYTSSWTDQDYFPEHLPELRKAQLSNNVCKVKLLPEELKERVQAVIKHATILNSPFFDADSAK